MTSNNLWQNKEPWLPTNQGGAHGGGGGGGVGGYPGPIDNFRDPLDAARSGGAFGNRTGDATYPDGYLGPSQNNRRAEKLASDVMGKLTDKNYQRGIHAGVKQPQANYFWPQECDPNAGIKREMAAPYVVVGSNDSTLPEGYQVRRQAPVGHPVTVLMHGSDVSQLSDAEKTKVMSFFGLNPAEYKDTETVDPTLSAAMKEYLPPWRW